MTIWAVLSPGQWFPYQRFPCQEGRSPSPSKERGTKGVRLINNPLPLGKGKGIKGIGLLKRGEASLYLCHKKDKKEGSGITPDPFW